MRWSDLEWVPMHEKVARPVTAGDLLASSGPLALCLAGHPPPRPRVGVWVTAAPMPETVKRVDPRGVVLQTVPRDELQTIGYPVVVPAELARRASDPEDLLRLALASGEARPLPVNPGDAR